MAKIRSSSRGSKQLRTMQMILEVMSHHLPRIREDFTGRLISNALMTRVAVLRGRTMLIRASGLEDVLHDNKQIQYWKNLAMKKMFGRWHLQIKLAKMTAYVESRFATSKPTADTTAGKYPPANEGMVHMVLAPTMGRIKSIMPKKIGTLLTKAWIQKLAQDVASKPSVTVAISYLEYLVRLQRDYKDMEKRYQLVRKQEFLNMPFSPDTQYYQLALLRSRLRN